MPRNSFLSTALDALYTLSLSSRLLNIRPMSRMVSATIRQRDNETMVFEVVLNHTLMGRRFLRSDAGCSFTRSKSEVKRMFIAVGRREERACEVCFFRGLGEVFPCDLED